MIHIQSTEVQEDVEHTPFARIKIEVMADGEDRARIIDAINNYKLPELLGHKDEAPAIKRWVIPDDKRYLFKHRIGKRADVDDICAMCEGGHHVVAVGDVVSAELWKHRFDGLNMRLYIFDGKTERHETTEFMDIINEKAFGPVIHACNPPGSITDELVAAVKDGLRGVSRYIHVDGEEDLALIPVIRYATEGTIVVYGWPGEGMMAVRVDESLRSQMVRLWQEMEQVGHDREEF